MKYYNPVTWRTDNICVPDCSLADAEMVNDETNKQCIFLGPFCGYSSITTNSVTGKDAN